MSTDTNPSPGPLATTSPLYEQIVEDFLARAAKDDAIPAGALKRLKAVFAAGPPKPAALTEAFGADDDLE